MNKNSTFILCIVILAITVILCNQIIHLHHLYKQEKIQYIHSQNEQKLYSYFKEKNDSIQLKNTSLQLILADCTSKIKNSCPGKYVTHSYPFGRFIQTSTWQIIITIFITLLLIYSVINLYHNYHNEQRSRKRQEEYIHYLVHDLKRPLENQIKICGVLPDIPEAERIELLKESKAQLRGMSQSINRMLIQSTDAHGLRLNLKEFNLKEMLETLIQPNRWKVDEGKEFHIQLQFQAPDKTITGDVDFLQAVFHNFIDNSLKYSGTRAEIIITRSAPDDRNFQIEIKDNGSGISPGALKHVFERYYRGDHQDNKKIKGHGQGLYYAYMIIKAHQGKINVSSTPGQGTTITVCLPKKRKTKKH